MENQNIEEYGDQAVVVYAKFLGIVPAY